MLLISRQFAGAGSNAIPERTEPDTFMVPAREAAYDFDVTVHCTSTVEVRRRVSPWLGEREFQWILETVRETTRSIGRRHSIFKPGEAELDMNKALQDRFSGTAERSVFRRWTVRAEVDIPDEVRVLIRKALTERYEIEAQAEATDLRIRKTNQSRLGWERFLDDAARNKIAHHAVRLAEDPHEIAETLKSVLDERQVDVRDLLALVKGIVESHQAVGLLDLSVNSDTVLRRTLELIGLELPPLDPEAILTPPARPGSS